MKSSRDINKVVVMVVGNLEIVVVVVVLMEHEDVGEDMNVGHFEHVVLVVEIRDGEDGVVAVMTLVVKPHLKFHNSPKSFKQP